jgi:hypothetical protein
MDEQASAYGLWPLVVLNSAAFITRSIAALVIALSLTIVGLQASAAEGHAQSSGVTRTSEAGRVTVSLTWSGDFADLAFLVVMDTHSVNLDQYDLAQLAILRLADGTERRPTAWNAPAGGHHREGTLVFASVDETGSPTVAAGTWGFEVAIRDVAGVPERTFRW